MVSLVHLHLLSNHIPVVGIPIAATVLVAALWMRNSAVARVGLLLLAGIAALSAIAYYTGDAASHAVRNIAGVTRASVHEHSDAADYAFIGACVAGAFAIGALWMFRGREIARWAVATSLGVALFVSSVMARTAYLGGMIRHTEIHEAAADSSAVK